MSSRPEQQRPLLAWLWPDRPPRAGAAERISARGIVRLALLIPATVLLAALAGSAVAAAAGGPVPLLVAIALAITASGWILARAWAAGTWVSDTGVVVRRTLQPVQRARWQEVASVEERDGCVWLVRTDATGVRTHVSRWGLDYLARPEARAIATARLRRWHAS